MWKNVTILYAHESETRFALVHALTGLIHPTR